MAPGKQEVLGRAVPPADSGAGAAKAGNDPLEMSTTTAGGCPGHLETCLASLVGTIVCPHQ